MDGGTSDEVDFSRLALRTTKVRGPDGQPYLLRGASAAAAVAFREANLRGQVMEDGKVVGIRGWVESEPLLVSMCLFPRDNQEGVGGPPVPVDRIKAWPVEFMKWAYEWVVDNSPGLVSRTRESLLEERARVDRQLAELDRRTDNPKGTPASTAGCSTPPTGAAGP